MSSDPIQNQLAPAYNAFLKSDPIDDTAPRTGERFQRLLEDAVAIGVSDIHLDPRAESYRLRFRLDGALHDVAELDKAAGERLIRFLATRAELDVAKPFEGQEGRAPFEVGGVDWELRFSTVPAVFGEKATMRLLSKDQIERGVSGLGMSDETVAEVRHWMEDTTGMMLVAGPTGSGKTTTLYALLHQFKQRARSIVTIEDPIEYPVEGTTQIEVNDDAGLTFADGLKLALRLDPDYLLLGEVRDQTSAVTAIDAAGAGRILMASIHARDAVGVVTTLRNYGVEDSEITASLEVVIAQRLVRKLCEACRQVGAPDEAEVEWLRRRGLAILGKSWQSAGCRECSNTGFKGRIGLFEIWRLDSAFREAIAAHASEMELRERLATAEHATLVADGLEKAAGGLTTISELQPVGALWAGTPTGA